MFLAAYGSPWLQALMGFGPDAADKVKRADHDLLREANEARLRASSKPQFEAGGLAEAMIRSLVYVGLAEQQHRRAGLRRGRRRCATRGRLGFGSASRR